MGRLEVLHHYQTDKNKQPKLSKLLHHIKTKKTVHTDGLCVLVLCVLVCACMRAHLGSQRRKAVQVLLSYILCGQLDTHEESTNNYTADSQHYDSARNPSWEKSLFFSRQYTSNFINFKLSTATTI